MLNVAVVVLLAKTLALTVPLAKVQIICQITLVYLVLQLVAPVLPLINVLLVLIPLNIYKIIYVLTNAQVNLLTTIIIIKI